MTGIEHPDLHVLPVRHIVHQLHASLFQRRASVGEPVFQHPLVEILGHQWQVVIQSAGRVQLLRDFRRDSRGNAIDHAVREGRVFLDPLGQFRIAGLCIAEEGLAGDIAIMAQVIAGHDRKRLATGIPATAQGFHDITENGGRLFRILKIGLYCRILQIERTGRLVDVVAAFRDRHGNDADGRINEMLQHGFRIGRGEQVVTQCAHDTHRTLAGRGRLGQEYRQS